MPAQIYQIRDYRTVDEKIEELQRLCEQIHMQAWILPAWPDDDFEADNVGDTGDVA